MVAYAQLYDEDIQSTLIVEQHGSIKASSIDLNRAAGMLLHSKSQPLQVGAM